MDQGEEVGGRDLAVAANVAELVDDVGGPAGRGADGEPEDDGLG